MAKKRMTLAFWIAPPTILIIVLLALIFQDTLGIYRCRGIPCRRIHN